MGTAFGIFKYMAAYSITQFISVIILYEKSSNLSDFQFLWIDLFLITTLAVVFGFTKAYNGPLASKPPKSSLIALQPIFSLISQLVIVILFQVAAFIFVQEQPWFVEFNYENPCYINTTAQHDFHEQGLDTRKIGCDPEKDHVASYENFAVFSLSQYQYII